MADVLRIAFPFAVFLAFLGYFRWRARRDGTTTGAWLHERNRSTFANLTTRKLLPQIVFTAIAWAVLFVASGFKPILLAILPVFLLWFPVMGGAFRWWYRRMG